MRKTAFMLCSLLLASAGTAFAGDEKEASMAELDANSDGQISEEEAQANTTIAKNFKTADVDSSGTLTRSEFIRAIAASSSEEEESTEAEEE